MSMDYVRRYYGVPAKRGGKVRLGSGFGKRLGGRSGTITGSRDPDWEVTYLP